MNMGRNVFLHALNAPVKSGKASILKLEMSLHLKHSSLP